MKKTALPLLTAVLLSGLASAESRELVVEGFLTDTTGAPIPDQDEYVVSVKLCVDATSQNCPWDDAIDGTVPIAGGYFQVRLGTNPNKPLTDSLFAGTNSLWFQLTLNGKTYPRTPLASVPYSFRSATTANADKVGGYAAAATPSAGKLLVLDGSGLVPSAALPVPSSLQCSGCVDGSDVLDGSLSLADLSGGVGCAANQVVTWDGNAFACKATAALYGAGEGIVISNLNVISLNKTKVQDFAKEVCLDSEAEMATAAPNWDMNGADDVTNATVAGGDLSGNYPGPSIKAGAVTGAKLGDGAVTASKIADGTISSAKLDTALEARLASIESRLDALQAFRTVSVAMQASCIANQGLSTPWIASTHPVGGDVTKCQINLKPGTFSQAPVCVAHSLQYTGTWPRYAYATRLAVTDSNTIFVNHSQTDSESFPGVWAANNAPFSVICVGTKGSL